MSTAACPPQIMVGPETDSPVSSTVLTCERPAAIASAASRIMVASSSPPPMVPAMEPSRRTSICAPAALGVEPCCDDERDQGERLGALKQIQHLVQDLTHVLSPPPAAAP